MYQRTRRDAGRQVLMPLAGEKLATHRVGRKGEVSFRPCKSGRGQISASFFRGTAHLREKGPVIVECCTSEERGKMSRRRLRMRPAKEPTRRDMKRATDDELGGKMGSAS